MNNTLERFEFLKNNLVAKFNVKNPIVEGVYHIISLRWINSPDGKQMLFFARCYWKEFGTKDFDTSFTTSICINSLFSRVAIKPDVINIDSKFFAILPEHGTDSFSKRHVHLSSKLIGLKIQIEDFSLFTNSYNNQQAKITWNFYTPKDIAPKYTETTSTISNYTRPSIADINKYLSIDGMLDSFLQQHSQDESYVSELIDNVNETLIEIHDSCDIDYKGFDDNQDIIDDLLDGADQDLPE